MNSYELFEEARHKFEIVQEEGFRPAPQEAWNYLDAAIAAFSDGCIFSDQLLIVWKQVKPSIDGAI